MSRSPATVDWADALERHRLHARLEQAIEALDPPPSSPVLAVDLDAFDANAADLARRAAGTPIRVASKSVRVPALLRRVLAHEGFHGVLCYTLAEALWLEEHGVSDDLVLGYPSVDRAALARLLASPTAAARITLMVDDLAQLDVVDAVRGSADVVVRVALDVDAGVRVAGQHVGPKRSPLHDVAPVLALARAVVARPGFALVGVMTYEGQVAGVADDVPRQRARSLVVRRLKDLSVAQLAVRRRAVADGLAEVLGGTPLEFWNAGGSGSVETTVADPVVTEVAAGSGLLGPTLFDHYLSFRPRPAAFFGLPVVRRPSADVATVHGGGLVASGAAGPDRLPTPWTPPGLHLTGLEGAGEVQTPLTGPPAALLRIGERVWFRHAKSGELFEHGTHAHLVQGGEDGEGAARVVEEATTYRGHGLVF